MNTTTGSTLKDIGIIAGVFIILGLIGYFILQGVRSAAINYLTSNSFVAINDFSPISTAVLAAWATHLKELDLGMSVSVTSFTYLGNNYSIQNGTKTS